MFRDPPCTLYGPKLGVFRVQERVDGGSRKVFGFQVVYRVLDD